MSERHRASFNWGLLFFWMVSTTMGWFLPQAVFPGLAIIITGFGIGILQWLNLQHRFHKAWRWIVVSGLGWGLAWTISYLALPFELEILAGSVFGLTFGTAQWLVLRREVHWSGWWIVASIVGWTTGLTLLPGALLSGTMAGLITGIALEVLLRFPRQLPIAQIDEA